MSSNIPKEPGFYPVMYYSEEQGKELYGCILLDKSRLEAKDLPESSVEFHDFTCYHSRLPSNGRVIKRLRMDNKHLEFGPRIEFPKGGWPKK